MGGSWIGLRICWGGCEVRLRGLGPLSRQRRRWEGPRATRQKWVSIALSKIGMQRG